MAGWYAIKRGITSHHLFKGKPERLIVWMWLMDNAAWKDTTHDVKGHTIKVPRGSVCASERHISNECGVGYQVVRTAMKRFKSEQMINATPTHGKNLITLCNYEKHQDLKTNDNATPNATLTQPQRNPNAQKEQGNKGTTEDTKVSSDFAPPAIDDVSQAIHHFNALAERSNWPKVQKLSPPRRSALLGRIKDVGGLDGWCEAITRASASPHLTGNNDRGWTATFDWLAKPANFTKLMEGNYDDRTHNKASPRNQAIADELLDAARTR